MFSWIIDNKTKILKIESWRFTVENVFDEELKIWESIAHDWGCMTVETFDNKTYTFFAMEETFKKTNFWTKNIWDFFNVERSLALWDKIHGHFVSGHVDSTWKVSKIEEIKDGSKIIYFDYNSDNYKYMIPKGSVTINWVSLTIVDLEKNNFSVSLIPLTQEITNLWDLIIWDTVNLEFDLLGKYVTKMVEERE